MFEYFVGKITNFDANGGRIFLDLGHILRGCSESSLCLYSGECISSIFFLEVRIGSILYRYYNWFETFPETCCEMLMKNYPSKFTSEILEKFSNTFRLFFLLDFLDEFTDNDYVILQVLHPILFFNSNECMNFHHLMQRFHIDNPQNGCKVFRPFLAPEFGFT